MNPHAALVLASLAVAACAQTGPTYAERLGWPEGSRVVFFHVDDVGMSHASNLGAREALQTETATSMSTMMPCPWVPEVASWLRESPRLDHGLHLTLTSEWDGYRWGPLAGRSRVPSLVDEEGCLWQTTERAVVHATADDVEVEIRAQIARAKQLGMPITHLDTHMGVLLARDDLADRYVKVGIEMQIPVLMVGGHATHARRSSAIRRALERGLPEAVWNAGLPVLDDLHGRTYGWAAFDDKKRQMIADLRSMKPGVTMVAVHCARRSPELDAITDSGPTRDADLRLVTDPEVLRVLQEEGIKTTNWRDLLARRKRLVNGDSARSRPDR